ncbi:MAG: ROK family protein [Candidatus Lokiarchaeota archaeon]|nr:ROK family protein [Candidatus Lokiarchaeota archaeon]
MSKKEFIIGADIGGTWIRVAISPIDLKEEAIIIKKTQTPKVNEYSISNAIISLITQLLVDNNIEKDQIVGIGLASAGPINIEKGEVFNNANLGFKELPLKKPIQERFLDVPIYLINDCIASVLAIHYFEANDDEKDNIVYITMSTGIGGGVICNGHLLLGKDGNAAEIGHGIVNHQSRFQCNCGAFGCWEAYSSGTGVRNRALEAIKTSTISSKILMFMVDNDETNITAKELFQAARGGDKFSKSIVNQCIFYSKIGVGLVNNFYDCVSIYFGGAMMKDSDLILPPLVEQFKTEPILFTINNPPQLKVTKNLDSIGVLGALTLVKYKLEENPIIL